MNRDTEFTLDDLHFVVFLAKLARRLEDCHTAIHALKSFSEKADLNEEEWNPNKLAEVHDSLVEAFARLTEVYVETDNDRAFRERYGNAHNN